MTATEPIALLTADGVTLRGSLHRPSGAPWGLALVGHAMMVDRRTMDRPAGAGLVSVLVERGLAALSIDFRGHGESAIDGRSYTLDDIVRYDVPAWVSALRDRFPTLPRFLVGHSLGVNAGLPGVGLLGGAGISAAVAFGLNLWAPQFERDPIRRLQKRAMLAGFDLLSRRTGRFDPKPFGMGRSAIPRAYVAQFGRFYREDAVRSLDGRDDYAAALGAIRFPVMVVSGGRDAIMGHPDAIDAYAGLLRGAEVVHRRFVGEGGFEPDHMGLVIDPRSRPMFEEAADFLAAVHARGPGFRVPRAG